MMTKSDFQDGSFAILFQKINMARPPKTDRNKELVKMRKSDPAYYSYRKLAEIFKLSHITVREIYKRETESEKVRC
jgi:hypothetical protein